MKEITANRIWPPFWWWALLLAIILVAGVLRFTGYDFSLPYVDHPDEPQFITAAQMIIDNGTAKPMRLHAYPPGLITLNYLLLRWVHDPSTHYMSVLGLARLISIGFSLGVVVLVGLLGYRLGTVSGGLFAAALWAINPKVVEYSRYATADNYVTFFTLLALFCVLTAVLFRRDRWPMAGTVAIILAILFKYQAIFVAPLVLLIPLWRVIREQEHWRQLLANFGWVMLVFGLFMFWLVLIFPILEANDIPNWVAPTDEFHLPSLSAIFEAVFNTFESLGDNTIRWFGLSGLLLLVVSRYRASVRMASLAVLAGAGVLWVGGVSAFGTQGFRQYVALAALLTLFSGFGLSLWGRVLCETSERLIGLHLSARRRQWFTRGILLLVVMLGSYSDLRASVYNAYEHTLPDRRNDLAFWMDRSLPPGGYIAPRENHKTFNGPWGGYTGIHEYPLVEMAMFPEKSVAEWRAMGALYAIPNYDVYQEMVDSHNPDVAQILLVKSYPPDSRYRGPSMVILRLYPIQNEATGQLGPIHLVGFDISTTTLQVGETLNFTLYWQAESPTGSDYVVYNHLVPLNSRQVLAQIDGPPLFDERRGTSDWDDPNETLISREFTLALDDDIPPGEYRLITGFYDRESGQRLLSPGGEDYLEVTTIEVTD